MYLQKQTKLPKKPWNLDGYLQIEGVGVPVETQELEQLTGLVVSRFAPEMQCLKSCQESDF